MRIFIVLAKAQSGECQVWFFKKLRSANKFAFEMWKKIQEEDPLSTKIGVYWVDLSSAFDSFSKPDGQISDKLDWGSGVSCFSPNKLVTNAMIVYKKYPGTFLAALENIVDLIGADASQDLRLKCEDARLALNKVYLDVLNASGIPLGYYDKY